MNKISDFLQKNQKRFEDQHLNNTTDTNSKHTKNDRYSDEEKERFYREGNEFEDYVITMFNPKEFELIHRTPTYEGANGEFDPSMICPDLGFKELSTGREFWVEMKFRKKVYKKGAFRFCDEGQLRKYKNTMFQSKCPVFIMIGIGGSTDRPTNVYCLNLDRINFINLFHDTYAYNRVEGMVESLDQLFDISQLKTDTSVQSRIQH